MIATPAPDRPVRTARRGRRAGLAVALLMLTVVAPASARADVKPRPVLNRDFADPFVMADGPGLVAYATNTTERDGRPIHVQFARSPDGRRWSRPVDAMPETPPWAYAPQPDIWAPEVLRVGGRYILYFSARHATQRRPDGRTLCVGAATADAPEGPFHPLAQPLTCGGRDGVIDVSPFAEGEYRWLYLKTDGNCCHAPVRFLAQPLAPDGLSVVGDAVALAGMASDQRWEGKVIEAPEMRRHDGQLVLFFAGNDYGGAHYAIGYARCDTPTGPCTEAAENPILASGHRLEGPGHESVFEWNGGWWLAYAAWQPGHPRYRAMYIAPLDWVDGRPVPDLPGLVPSRQ